MQTALDPSQYDRLPWTLNDNILCDGCPDMTVHDGKLVWSYRLDEQLQYGCFLTAAPKQEPLVQVQE